MTFKTGLFSKNQYSIFNLIIVSVLFVLSGCTSTQPPLSYYLLHSAVPSKQSEVISLQSASSLDDSTPLLLKSVTLPDYLKHRGLVYQVSDTNLHISTTHLWAEPFEEGLRKTLQDQLANHGIVMLTTTDYQHNNIVELSLHISDFVSTFNGNIVLKGEFVLTSELTVNGRYPFFIETRLKEDGFSASIVAMRRALADLSTQITESTKAQYAQ